MTIEIKDELNNLDLSLAHVTKVIEEKTTAYPNFTTFLLVHFTSGENVALKGWTLDRWRELQKRNSE